MKGAPDMKRRRQKAWVRRHVRAAVLSYKRELGDHRRWWWMATMPFMIKDDPVLGDTEVYFDPRYGRCYRPQCFSGNARAPKVAAGAKP